MQPFYAQERHDANSTSISPQEIRDAVESIAESKKVDLKTLTLAGNLGQREYFFPNSLTIGTAWILPLNSDGEPQPTVVSLRHHQDCLDPAADKIEVYCGLAEPDGVSYAAKATIKSENLIFEDSKESIQQNPDQLIRAISESIDQLVN